MSGDGSPCRNFATERLGDVELCAKHHTLITDRVVQELVYGDSDRSGWQVFAFRLREGLAHCDRRARAATQIAQARALRPDVVYYVERDGLIKIGHSKDLAKRLKSLSTGGVAGPDGMRIGPVKLLLTHGGGRDAEQEMHTRFAADRVTGEWFRKSPALLDHIERLKSRMSRAS